MFAVLKRKRHTETMVAKTFTAGLKQRDGGYRMNFDKQLRFLREP